MKAKGARPNAADPLGAAGHRKQSGRCSGWYLTTLLALGVSQAQASDGYLIDWNPGAIDETLAQGRQTSVPLRLTFFNAGSTSLDVVVYVQGDPGCPASADAPVWIPFAPELGNVPAGAQAEFSFAVPLSASDLLPGVQETHLCVRAEADVPTRLAIPVRLRVMPATYVFADDFETVPRQ